MDSNMLIKYQNAILIVYIDTTVTYVSKTARLWWDAQRSEIYGAINVLHQWLTSLTQLDVVARVALPLCAAIPSILTKPGSGSVSCNDECHSRNTYIDWLASYTKPGTFIFKMYDKI